jgi:hypothetical protein
MKDGYSLLTKTNEHSGTPCWIVAMWKLKVGMLGVPHVTIPHGSSDWVRIAEEIELNYQNFDSFVVLHGTDTMAYSSSALSFLLEDLGKTVVSLERKVDRSALNNPYYRFSPALRFRYPSSAMTR